MTFPVVLLNLFGRITFHPTIPAAEPRNEEIKGINIIFFSFFRTKL